MAAAAAERNKPAASFLSGGLAALVPLPLPGQYSMVDEQRERQFT
jgi:hypothetical protein